MGIILQKQKVETEVVVDVTCDRCGESCKNIIGGDSFNFQYANAGAHWGYGTGHDGDSYSFQLCEKCFFVVLQIGGITPKIVGGNWG